MVSVKREKVKVEIRNVLGKKVKKLRREGILPVNIYGKGIESTAGQMPIKEFKDIFKKVHETGLIDVEYDDKSLPSLIHNVQLHPVTHDPLHADFFKVNLKEKIIAKIPIEAAGEPQAELDKKGLLMQPLQELEVEALPTDLPEKIEVNVEKLAEVNDQIDVKDIKIPADVTVLTEPSQVVFKIEELVSKEAEEQAAAEEAEAAEAATEGAEQAPEGEGEQKPTEGAEQAPEGAKETEEKKE